MENLVKLPAKLESTDLNLGYTAVTFLEALGISGAKCAEIGWNHSKHVYAFMLYVGDLYDDHNVKMFTEIQADLGTNKSNNLDINSFNGL